MNFRFINDYSIDVRRLALNQAVKKEKKEGGGSQNSSPNTIKKEKKSKKDKSNLLEIGSPYNLEHRAHVDFDMNWSTPDVFVVEEKLGQGYY